VSTTGQYFTQSAGCICRAQGVGGLLSRYISCVLLLIWRAAYPTANSLRQGATRRHGWMRLFAVGVAPVHVTSCVLCVCSWPLLNVFVGYMCLAAAWKLSRHGEQNGSRYQVPHTLPLDYCTVQACWPDTWQQGCCCCCCRCPHACCCHCRCGHGHPRSCCCLCHRCCCCCCRDGRRHHSAHCGSCPSPALLRPANQPAALVAAGRVFLVPLVGSTLLASVGCSNHFHLEAQ
jgi:hypothetical protein